MYEYKKNEQSPPALNHWALKQTTTYDLGNPGPGLRQAQQWGGIKSVNGIPACLFVWEKSDI